ncbi:MAG: CPBP family intramembrane metalloprotease [Chloroflexi bacterium]|nr:CPBP family intramembrane metalloprotease [Chloroflexota bacterium]
MQIIPPAFLSSDNRLFLLARSGKRLPNFVGAVALSLLFLFGGQIIGGIPALILIGAVSQGATTVSPIVAALSQALLLIFSFAPIFLVLWIWLSLYEKRPLWTTGMLRQGALRKYIIGLLAGVAAFSAVVGVLSALGCLSVNPEASSTRKLSEYGGVLIIFLGWLIQGPGEEILCRGWLLPVLGARYKPWVGLLGSALLFAFYHSLNPGINPLAVVNLFLFGIFIAFYVLAEGSLWGAFAFHSMWNWAEGNLFGLQVSGLPLNGTTLLNLRTQGASILTGGSFGPEGGLAVTLILILGIALIVWGIPKFKRSSIETPPISRIEESK